MFTLGVLVLGSTRICKIVAGRHEYLASQAWLGYQDEAIDPREKVTAGIIVVSAIGAERDDE